MSDNVVDGFALWLQGKGRSPKTVHSYLLDLKGFIHWFNETVEPFEIQKLTVRDIVRYRDHLQAQDYKPATINRYLISIKRLMYFAYEHELIRKNVAKDVDLVAIQEAAPRQLSDQEERKLVRAVESYGTQRDQTIITVLRQTGLRASELCNLKWNDVALKERSGGIWVKASKGNKYRSVPLPLASRKALEEYRATLPPDSVYVFASRKSDRLNTRGLAYLIEKYARLAQIDKVTPHDLRHRCAYVMSKQFPLTYVQQILGHESLNTTAIYTTPTMDDLQKAVDAIDWG